MPWPVKVGAFLYTKNVILLLWRGKKCFYIFYTFYNSINQ